MVKNEEKELRKEVRTIKSNLADLGQGVYLSAGGIIIILLILILLSLIQKNLEVGEIIKFKKLLKLTAIKREKFSKK